MAELRFVHMVADSLEARGTAMVDLVKSKQRWVQFAWAFLCMGSIGVIVAQVWRMMFGRVLFAAVGLLAGVAVANRWRYGPIVFVSVAGGIWAVSATHPVAAIMVTLALLLWVAQLTVPYERQLQGRGELVQPDVKID